MERHKLLKRPDHERYKVVKRSLFFTDDAGVPSFELEKEERKNVQPKNVSVWVKPKAKQTSDACNNYCEICLKHVSYVPSLDVCCLYCNVVCHIACLREDGRDEVAGGNWVCLPCSDEIAVSKEVFLNGKLKEAVHIQRNNAQVIISKYVRRRIQLIKWKKMKLAVKFLTNFSKTIKVKKLIYKVREAKLRPLFINLENIKKIKIPTHEANQVSVHITVLKEDSDIKEEWSLSSKPVVSLPEELDVDKDRKESMVILGTDNKQHIIKVQGHHDFKHHFNCEFNEQILIPGISAHHVCIFTVIQNAPETDIFLGQCSLRFDNVWSYGGQFSLPLKYMEYPPQRRHNSAPLDDSYFIVMMENLMKQNLALKRDREKHGQFSLDNPMSGLTASDRHNGYLTFNVEIKRRSHARCGLMDASSPEDVIKYAKYFPLAKSVILLERPLRRAIAVGKSRSKVSIAKYAIKQNLWYVIVDEFMYIFSAFGGVLKYMLNLRYCKIQIKFLNNDINSRMRISVTAAKNDPGGYDLLPMIFMTVVRRETMEMVESAFSARRHIHGVVYDYNLIIHDLHRAIATESRRIEEEREKKNDRKSGW